MRHKVYGRKLGRNKDSRKALFKGLVQSLINFETIETTEAKAKAIKGLVDKLINQAKSPSTRRLVSQFLSDKKTAEKLIKDLAPRLGSRNSGYTSTVKMGRRVGDNTMVVRMSLLLEEPKTKVKEVKKEESKVSKPKVQSRKAVKKQG